MLLPVLLMSLLVLGGSPTSADTAEPTDKAVVRMFFFWSETCPHCHEVMEKHLPKLVAKYGDQLEIASIPISDAASYETYLAAIQLFEVPPQRQGVPAVFIGDTHLVGSNEIAGELDGLIGQYLAQGGVAYPPLLGLNAVVEQPVQAVPPEVEAKPIYLVYFSQTGCQDCDRVKGDLNYLQTRYPQLIVEEYDVRDEAALCEWLGERAGVPASRRLTAPTVFVGEDYLLEEDLDAHSLEALLSAYTPGGAERAWAQWERIAEDAAQQGLLERFKSLGILTIVLAGLVDGLNPCAFATLILFVSYLTLSGRKGKEILWVGAAFTCGVFLAYMLVGIGFYHTLELLGDLLTTLGRWLYALTAAFCTVLAVVSFLDYLKARRGEIGDMTLSLPHKLRMGINAAVRKMRRSRAFVTGAFVIGITISFLELACTGQVYLPTIIFVTSVPELRVQAILLLLLYNALFVAPLVVVFFLVYHGTGAKQLTHFLQRRASTVKLCISFLFLILGGWLAFSLL
jgi:cytochrome c biogenesis protein CcdA/thiol-disulfide isomerase/thioredoxin